MRDNEFIYESAGDLSDLRLLPVGYLSYVSVLLKRCIHSDVGAQNKFLKSLKYHWKFNQTRLRDFTNETIHVCIYIKLDRKKIQLAQLQNLYTKTRGRTKWCKINVTKKIKPVYTRIDTTADTTIHLFLSCSAYRVVRIDQYDMAVHDSQPTGKSSHSHWSKYRQETRLH